MAKPINEAFKAFEPKEGVDPIAHYTGLGLVFGIVAGVVFSGLGIALGMCLGLCIGAAIGTKVKNEQEEDEPVAD